MRPRDGGQVKDGVWKGHRGHIGGPKKVAQYSLSVKICFPLPSFSWRMESQQQCGIRHLHGRILQCVTILPAQWCGHYCHPSSASTTYGQCHVYIADSERPQPHRPPSSLFYFVPQESHSQAGLATAPHSPTKNLLEAFIHPF